MSTVFSKDGTKIAYDLLGSGPQLVMITGAICHRRFMPVQDDARHFATVFSVYNYDRRGRGESGDTLPYSMDKELDDIEALIDAAGEPCILYGHSSGAVLALEAGLRMPQKISRVVIYDAAYSADEAGKEVYSVTVNKVLGLLRESKNAAALKTFLIGIGMPKLFVFFLPLMPGWKQLKNLAPTLAYDMELTKEPAVLSRFQKLQVPVEILYGEKSPPSMKTVAENLGKAIPGSSVKAVPKQDHMVSAKVLLPYLKSPMEN